MPRFLFILSSHEDLGNSGMKTGSWLEELAAPYWRYLDVGFEVEMASPKGGAVPLDPMSLEDSWVSEAGRRFMSDEAARKAIANTNRLEDVDPDRYDGIYLVGGTATTWDFPHNSDIKRIAEACFTTSKVISGICHGVVGLSQAIDQHGAPIIKNRKITAISNAEDMLMGVDKIVPVLPEELLRKQRALYSAGPPLSEYVVCDAPFFTAQNPASANLLATKIIEHLQS
jgi:putative intracellular protease/amidase